MVGARLFDGFPGLAITPMSPTLGAAILHGDGGRLSEVEAGLAVGHPAGPVVVVVHPWRVGHNVAVRRGKARIFSGCKSRPDNWSLHPVAIGAAVEATKPSKPSRSWAASGGSASRQAAST